MEAQLKVPQGELNPTLWDPKALTLRSGADARLLGVDRPGQHQNQVVFGAALSRAFSQAALADGIASSNRTANAGRGRGPWGTAPWPDGTGARCGAVVHLKATQHPGNMARNSGQVFGGFLSTCANRTTGRVCSGAQWAGGRGQIQMGPPSPLSLLNPFLGRARRMC